MRGLPILLLALLPGCLAPVTNAAFYEDEEFLAAVPSEAWFGAPANLVEAQEGDAEILSQAKTAALDLEALLAPAVASGEALREIPATDRTETLRAWDEVPASMALDDGATLSWWVRATLIRPDGLAVEWEIEVAENRIGPWAVLASGRHEASGAGTWTLDMESTASSYDWPLPGTLEVDYSEQSLDGSGPHRFVQVEHKPPVALDGYQRQWALYADGGFTWTDLLHVTDDGQGWPGVAVVFQIAAGGRAEGRVYRDSEEILFWSCWDPNGDFVWREGSSGIAAAGTEEACAIGSLTEPPP